MAYAKPLYQYTVSTTSYINIQHQLLLISIYSINYFLYQYTVSTTSFREIYEVQLMHFCYIILSFIQHNVELFRSSGIIPLAQYYSNCLAATYDYFVPFVHTSLRLNTYCLNVLNTLPTYLKCIRGETAFEKALVAFVAHHI